MKKRVLILVAFTAFALGFIAAFYTRFETLSDQMEASGFSGSAANAIKHAYAAAQVYNALRILHMTPDLAFQTVIYLGYGNEAIERITKFSKPDSDTEVKKDLYNNLAGLTAASWHEANGSIHPVLDDLVALAKNGTLVVQREHLPFGGPEDPIEWFELHYADIHSRVMFALNGRSRL